MHNVVRLASSLGLIAMGTSGCTAESIPPDSSPASTQSSEHSGKQASAFSPACSGGGGPNAAGLSVSVSQGSPPSVDFAGWCFNGGDPVVVWIVDEPTNRILTYTTVTAGSDDGFLPGVFSGSLGGGCGSGTTAHLVAYDFYTDTSAQSASFNYPAVCTQTFTSAYFDLQEENAQASLTISSDGNFEYRGGVHDYGAGADFYAMDAYPTQLPSGSHGPLWDAQGQVFGTFEPGSRDSNWDATGYNSELASNWDSIVGSGITFHLHIASDIGADIAGVAIDVGVAALAVFVGGQCIRSVQNNSATVGTYQDNSGGAGVELNCH
jgi:hypothetical protein